jgi:hypothetical protein
MRLPGIGFFFNSDMRTKELGMAFNLLMGLSSPMTWLVVMMMIAGWRHVFRKPERRPDHAARIIQSGATAPDGMGSALQFFSMAYRPNHAFVAKAQIVEREDQDEDDQGGPDTPRRQFVRQLRRIRRGEQVDRLVWRLE